MDKKVKVDGKEVLIDEANKKLLVKIGPKYFWKTSDAVVRVITGKGKKYYRKNSRLLDQDILGDYMLKTNTVISPDGWKLNKYSPEVIQFTDRNGNEAYDLEHFFENIDGILYHDMDARIITCKISGRKMFKDDATLLDKSLYGPDSYVHNSEAVELDGKIVYSGHVIDVVCPDGRTKKASSQEKTVLVFNGKVNENADTVLSYIDMDTALASDIDKFLTSRKYGILYTESSNLEEVIKDFEDRVWKAKSRSIRKNITLTDGGSNENSAEAVYPHATSLTGGKKYFSPNKKSPVLSSTRRMTGGIGYTFGVEVETTAGLIPVETCNNLGLSIFGDRTIPAAEYVTGVMNGDAGVNRLKEIYKEVSKNCYIDDKCSTHIHIGGIKGNPLVDTPQFNRRFSALSIMLGTQLEKELYQIQPKSRNPTNRHCKSIMEFAGNKIEDAKKTIAKYVFECPSLDRDANIKATLGKWTPSRYKWLNLVNCNSDNRRRSAYGDNESSGFKTIEFRLWAPTSDFDTVYNYLLISMAFVWFVENRQSRIIKGGLTLSDVIKLAFKRNRSIYNRLSNFITESKLRYKRENPYSEPSYNEEYRGPVGVVFEDEIYSQVDALNGSSYRTSSKSTGGLF